MELVRTDFSNRWNFHRSFFQTLEEPGRRLAPFTTNERTVSLAALEEIGLQAKRFGIRMEQGAGAAGAIAAAVTALGKGVKADRAGRAVG